MKKITPLMKSAKKILSKDTYKKLKSIKDKKEKEEVLKYALSSNIEIRYHNLEEELEKKEKDGDDKEKFFLALTKIKLLPPKIRLFNEIEEEIG